MVCPRAVTELIGPYISICSSQCFHSAWPLGGMSVMFPRIGHGIGPGGRGNFGWRPNVLRIMNSANTTAATLKRSSGGNIVVIMLVKSKKASQRPEYSTPLLQKNRGDKFIDVTG